MKKIFLMLLMAFAVCISLIACNTSGGETNGDEPSGDSGGSIASECETLGHDWVDASCAVAKTCARCGATEGTSIGHEYTILKVSDTQHWYECAICDEEKPNGKEDHTGGNATCLAKAICAVCSISYGELGDHAYNESVWEYRESDGHAHKCTLCDTYTTPIAHTPNIDAPTEDTAKFCTAEGCGYIIAQALNHEHTKADAWEYNTVNHWHDCTANDGMEYDVAPHTFDNSCDTDCNDGCGYTRQPTHSFTVLKNNESQHWYECSVCNTENAESRTSHSFDESVLKKATTFEKGEMKHTCSCAYSYKSDIPATKTLKVLAIGNSFSQDAMEHLYLVCKDAGIESVVLGNLYKGGCSLSTHLSYMENGTDGYTFYLSSDASGGMVKNKDNATALYAIEYADWDYITLQQASQSSGKPDTYSALPGVISYVNEHKTSDAELVWHMTWAYQANSTHSGFANYGNNQGTMYSAIISTVQGTILTNKSISKIIPNGTAIQNLRTSHLGDTLTRDGYHLSLGLGRYTAALTYLAVLTGYDISSIDAIPSSYADVGNHLDCIKEAVKNAIAKPYEVTESSYPPEDTVLNTTLSPLTDEDRAYLTSKGYDPDGYMLLDLTIYENAYYHSTSTTHYAVRQSPASTHDYYYKFLATQIFTRSELINGSLIRVNSGYQYRPDGWDNYPSINSLSRPGNVSAELTVVSDDWWGNYNHRAFNISVKSSGVKIYESDAQNFRIYVPVAKREALNADDKAYLEGLGFNPDEYLALDLSYVLHAYYNSSKNNSSIVKDGTDFCAKYICTQIFSRYDITLGSVIRIKSGYQYRPEAWIKLNQNNAERPVNETATTTIVDSVWWGNWNYRAFNLSNKDGSSALTDAEALSLRIYVKVK